MLSIEKVNALELDLEVNNCCLVSESWCSAVFAKSDLTKSGAKLALQLNSFFQAKPYKIIHRLLKDKCRYRRFSSFRPKLLLQIEQTCREALLNLR